ncbi:MAG: YceD family protein [Actinomycetota bacterium]
MRLVDVQDLISRPGVSKRLEMSARIDGLYTEMITVGEETAFRCLLESVVEGVLVTGSLLGRMTCRCARCLKEFSRDFDVRVRELFAHAPTKDDDHYPIVEGEIDLEPMARDAVLLDVPFSPLCKSDCLGLCSRCGGDRNLGECACGPEVDERWAALSTLKIDD